MGWRRKLKRVTVRSIEEVVLEVTSATRRARAAQRVVSELLWRENSKCNSHRRYD